VSRYIKLAAAFALLAALYWHCDWRRVAEALAALDAGYLFAALLLFVPQTLVSAWRWQSLAAPLARISLLEAVRQTLAASAWNLAAPSKLGDLTKAAMLPLNVPGARRRAWGLVILEKAADVSALALIWLAAAVWQAGSGWPVAAGVIMVPVGMLLSRRADRCGIVSTRYSVLSTQRSPSADTIVEPATPHSSRTPHSPFRLAAASLALWLLHLLQIHLMLLAAGVSVGPAASMARVPAAIFAGLLPLSVCGIGTRDGALVWLFSDVAPAGTMAAVGLLTTTRYLVPGAAGIACLWRCSQLASRFDGAAARPVIF
jgi:hypothetical protein